MLLLLLLLVHPLKDIRLLEILFLFPALMASCVQGLPVVDEQILLLELVSLHAHSTTQHSMTQHRANRESDVVYYHNQAQCM